MKLNLKRPIAFFDLETTGLNITHDRIVEVSVLRINVNGEEEQRTWRINPGIPIPPETTAIHGISDADAVITWCRVFLLETGFVLLIHYDEPRILQGQ